MLDIGGYYKNTVTLAPSLEMSYDEMDLAHDALDLLITECKKVLIAGSQMSQNIAKLPILLVSPFLCFVILTAQSQLAM